VRGTDAVKALGAVVDYVLMRRGVEKLNLIGWSWGTTICATYTTENQGKVERLVLYAPAWLRTTPSLIQVQGKLGAYRVVTREQTLGRWLTGVPEEKKAALIPAGWFDMWADATFATDLKGEGRTLRAPNGVILDGQEYFGATPPKPYWDPAKITSPVLLVLAEWDRDLPPYMAQALYPLLTNAAWKRHVVLSQGTHTIAMEKNGILLFRTVQQLAEAGGAGNLRPCLAHGGKSRQRNNFGSYLGIEQTCRGRGFDARHDPYLPSPTARVAMQQSHAMSAGN